LDWLLLAALGIMWVAFLLPSERRRHAASTSVEEFGRRMELLAQVEANGEPGRWILTPRKGVRFVGPSERRRARTRERRRQVLTFLLESIGITFLIGLVPPLHVMWGLTAGLVGVLALYVWLLVSLKARAPRPIHERVAASRPRPVPAKAIAPRYVVDGRSSRARPTFNGLGSLGEGDRVHVVVRSKAEVGAARA
jgi:Flp pilus assembly protein TadB